jgi:hypothetical protein
VASKGHFAVYTAGGMRFEVPLVLLDTTVFIELCGCPKKRWAS